jgi:hypothetical protein
LRVDGHIVEGGLAGILASPGEGGESAGRRRAVGDFLIGASIETHGCQVYCDGCSPHEEEKRYRHHEERRAFVWATLAHLSYLAAASADRLTVVEKTIT